MRKEYAVIVSEGGVESETIILRAESPYIAKTTALKMYRMKNNPSKPITASLEER